MLINLIIIYFACGSPVGVYRVTRMANWRSARLSDIGAHFVLWPIFVPALVRHAVRAPIDGEIARVRAAMERIVVTAGQSISISTFKEVFESFTSLTMALHRDESLPRELFQVTGHKNCALATACLDRRNLRLIKFHQLRARKDFMQMIDLLRGSGNAIVDLGSQIANILNDEQTVDELLALK